jgi:hypothetical protein
MSVSIGENDVFGVPFPLVLADRFFHIYSSPYGYKLDVFRWDEEKCQAIYDMKDSVIQVDEVGSSPTGFVEFSEPTGWTILYKFRPRPGVSQISGKVPLNGEFQVKITYGSIIVSVDGRQIANIEKNTITGSMIGLFIGADGSFARGSDKLPEGMDLARNKSSGIKNPYVLA